MMKKILSQILVLAMIVALSACGTSSTGDTSTGTATDGNAAATLEEDTSIPISEDRPVIEDSSVVEEVPEVELDGVSTITYETEEGTIEADDGTVVMTYSYQIPTVEVPNDPEVSEIIQTDLDEIVDNFLADLEARAEEAKSIYEEIGSGEDTAYMYSFTGELSFTVTRCDEQVLSFRIDTATYSGGTREFYDMYGRSYDVMTGSCLTFEDLGGDEFVSLCKESVLAQVAEAKETTDGIFDEYETYIDWVVQDGTSDPMELYGTDEATVEPEFYFDEDGITFISGEGVFQDYATGILCFTVTYEELEDVLTETYMPT